MYTLRIFTKDFDHKGGLVNVTYYIQNLSTDYDKAVEKAERIAKHEGFPLNLNVGMTEDDSLNEIVRGERRPSAEVIRANIKQAEAVVAKNDFWVFKTSIRTFSRGKWEGETVYNVLTKDRDYLEWLVDSDLDSLQIDFIKTVLDNNPDTRKPSEYVGELKQRITVDVVIKKTFTVESFYGTSLMIGMEDSEGNVFVSFYSGAADSIWNLEEGDEVSVTGTIKKHDEYKGVKQTSLNRIKVK